MRRFSLVLSLLLLTAGAAARSESLAFRPDDNAGFEFDTGVLRGKLRAGGKSLGLSSVIHVPTGRRLDRSNGLFSHYRVFTVGRRYGGGAWDWPSTAKLSEDGAVEVDFPDAEGRPFRMQARYRWTGPAVLDLETRVKALQDLPGFESFLASYFSEPFTNSLVFVERNPERNEQPGFLAARQSVADWHVFPRDEAIVPLIQDGRWKLEPNPVAWVIRPRFAQPLALRRAPGAGLTAVLMAPARDCFAVATPHEAEGHYSTYLSLFGRDLRAGETATARTRLVIQSDLPEAAVPQLYEAFVRSLPAQ